MAGKFKKYRLGPRVVYYAWKEKGKVRFGHTVVDGFDQEDAGRRLLKGNRHLVVLKTGGMLSKEEEEQLGKIGK